MRKYDMNDIENDIPQNAVSVYGSDSTMDEFPILKAFQEYINAEQAKARKRITALAVFFGVLLIALLAIFMTLLVKSYDDNQHLNDRLVDFMQQERERSDKEHAERERAAAEAAARPSRDSAAVIELTKKIETLQEKIYNAQRKADDAGPDVSDSELFDRRCLQSLIGLLSLQLHHIILPVGKGQHGLHALAQAKLSVQLSCQSFLIRKQHRKQHSPQNKSCAKRDRCREQRRECNDHTPI